MMCFQAHSPRLLVKCITLWLWNSWELSSLKALTEKISAAWSLLFLNGLAPILKGSSY